jgi:hypothetical protein
MKEYLTVVIHLPNLMPLFLLYLPLVGIQVPQIILRVVWNRNQGEDYVLYFLFVFFLISTSDQTSYTFRHDLLLHEQQYNNATRIEYFVDTIYLFSHQNMILFFTIYFILVEDFFVVLVNKMPKLIGEYPYRHGTCVKEFNGVLWLQRASRV